jgi:eukaryotic-like serine/threonine-protein kinase
LLLWRGKDKISAGGKVQNSHPKLLADRYELLDFIGTGGMATVYRALDRNLQREVAIKILHQNLIEDPAFRARFLLEARSAANLIHPNIVTVYDFGNDDTYYFIVMEYVDGTDLKSLIRRQGILPVSQAVDLLIQICAGIGYAHRAGLIHCDLKPQNILVATDNRIKITDFGIARAMAAIQPDEHTEIVWGSPQYFSPEQASGGPPSPASDVYALGIILFEMLTNHLPFEGEDSVLLASQHQVANPPSPREYNSQIPHALEQIIFKVLSKEASARYRTADQFGRILLTFSDNPRPARAVPAYMPPAVPAEEEYQPTIALGNSEQNQVDWLAVGLGLLAFLAVGGLIPLWLWTCLLYPSCPFSP